MNLANLPSVKTPLPSSGGRGLLMQGEGAHGGGGMLSSPLVHTPDATQIRGEIEAFLLSE